MSNFTHNRKFHATQHTKKQRCFQRALWFERKHRLGFTAVQYVIVKRVSNGVIL
jgi:hypothetical protein